MKLIVIEHDGRQCRLPSLRAITLARLLGGDTGLLVIGHDVDGVAESLRCYGATAVYAADHSLLKQPLADRFAPVIAEVARLCGADTLLATSTTFSRDVLPRVAAVMNWPMVSDVVAVERRGDQSVFRRPVYAGSAFADVIVDAPQCVLTARAAAFEEPGVVETLSPVHRVAIDANALPDGTEFISSELRTSDRPELTEARVVVSGGRPLKDRESFDRLIGGLADALGGAVGATRAIVDAGIVPNDWQVGQTGKIVAPELYVAVGISGSIQHLAGIKDARVIVAINQDPEAPIFQFATYGLVGDLFQIVPELTREVRTIHT